MPRKMTVLPTVSGRRQDDRPPLTAVTPIDAERALSSAMLVPIEQIVPDPDQPRRDMGGERLAELAASLKEYDVLQPLLVREYGYLEDGRTRYMIVAGGRRYAAAQQAGLPRLPVVVRDSEGAALRVTQLIENVQRQDLAPLEEARAFKELMDAEGLDSVALGKRLHITGQHVRDRLLLLSDTVMADAVQRQQVAPTVAREILRLPDESRTKLRARIDAGEPVSHADVQKARARNATEGIINPRATGGGRSSRKEALKTAPEGAIKTVDEQTLFAGASTYNAVNAVTPTQLSVDELARAVSALDSAMLDAVISYGADRQWTCQQLIEAISEQRLAATT